MRRTNNRLVANSADVVAALVAAAWTVAMLLFGWLIGSAERRDRWRYRR